MKSPQITWISKHDPPEAFPSAASAFDVPDGLLAAGGDLSVPRLTYAYQHGIFPWYDEGQPILWWSPDPRCILYPAQFRVSRRLARYLRNSEFEVSFNCHFGAVVTACAASREDQGGTWITSEMQNAYESMHAEGWAHSVEIWKHDTLVGGLYGLSIGTAFFGESMFSAASHASKAALYALCRILVARKYLFLDCQVESPHLLSLGATLMKRNAFLAMLNNACEAPDKAADWPQDRRKINNFGDL